MAAKEQIPPRETRIEERIFTRPFYHRDIDAAFYPGQKDLLLNDAEAIKNQGYNILSTLIGSEWFQPEYGSNLPLANFQDITETNTFLLKQDTIDALERWLPTSVILDRTAAIVEQDTNRGAYYIVAPFSNNNNQVIGTFSFRVFKNG